MLQIISKYGRPVTSIESFHVSHGSQLTNSRSKCVFCRKNNTMRKCPDCPFQPALYQVSGRDCHSIWHSTSHLKPRNEWFRNRRRREKRLASSSLDAVAEICVKRAVGHPKGSKNLRKRRGHYCSQLACV